MRKIFILLMLLLCVNIVTAIDECKSVIQNIDVPCRVFLPVNVSDKSCGSVNISFFLNNTFIYSNFMDEVNSFTCGSNFTQDSEGSYTFSYSTGDSGSITVIIDKTDRLFLYILALLLFFGLLGFSIFLDDPVFAIIAGMLVTVIAINIFINGFPNLDNEFLKNSIVTVLAGAGFFFLIFPSLKLIENWEGFK